MRTDLFGISTKLTGKSLLFIRDMADPLWIGSLILHHGFTHESDPVWNCTNPGW